jgi:hypothetical protein
MAVLFSSDSLSKWKFSNLRWITETVMTKLNENNVKTLYKLWLSWIVSILVEKIFTYRGVEILKSSTCPRASYLKKVTCPDKILLFLFFYINIWYLQTQLLNWTCLYCLLHHCVKLHNPTSDLSIFDCLHYSLGATFIGTGN